MVWYVLKIFLTNACHKKPRQLNRADSDQTAPEEAVWSESALFAVLKIILWEQTYFENQKRKQFKILQHLPYDILKLHVNVVGKWVLISWVSLPCLFFSLFDYLVRPNKIKKYLCLGNLYWWNLDFFCQVFWKKYNFMHFERQNAFQNA